MKTIKEFLRRRALKILHPVRMALPESFVLAGGAFGKQVNDIDIFPIEADTLNINGSLQDVACVASTKNADTWNIYGHTVQCCNYRYATLKELVESFDFAHIQAGVRVTVNAGCVAATEVYLSRPFVVSRTIGESWYTGSNYPLSSLVRLNKYSKRGAISKGGSIEATLSILADIVGRGFTDYEDFKDQLDAVDLGLVTEDMDSITLASCRRLFDLLAK
jgi:hypothetical protein